MYLYSSTAQNLFSSSVRKTPCKSKPTFSNQCFKILLYLEMTQPFNKLSLFSSVQL